MRLICCSIVFILCPHLSYDLLISVYLMERPGATCVDLISVAIHGSPTLLGHINERFGIENDDLSLSVIIGGVFGFLWAPNLFG